MSAVLEHSPATDPKYGGSKEGILHHYDIGNDYWGLMLGPAFAYSAALYHRPGRFAGGCPGAQVPLAYGQRPCGAGGIGAGGRLRLGHAVADDFRTAPGQ